jgi:threonine dehydratase
VDAPSFADILAARATVAAHLTATPAWSAPALDAAVGCRVTLKHEHVQPTGAFKVRGGVVLLAGLDAAQRARGLVACSTGNHGQSVAYAAATFDAPCHIVLPRPANPTKVRALRALGAEVHEHGDTLEDAGARARAIAAEEGARFVHPADEPALIAGVGTLYVELLAAAPELDYLLVPVGGGSGAAAACLVTAALAPRCRVIGVQSAASPAAHDSWRRGELLQRPNRTAVEGLATGAGFATTQRILRGRLHDFVLVTDAEVRAAQLLLLTHAHTVAEGAGAAGLAGLLALRERLAGHRVGVVVTGGNASPDELMNVLDQRRAVA